MNSTIPQLDIATVSHLNGIEEWRLNGILHRIDGPAVTGNNGSTQWIFNGKHHRIDGPAITMADGTLQWATNGVRHRTDGPAITYADGSEDWYYRGVLHRDGYLPAKSGGCYKIGVRFTFKKLQTNGHRILRFMRYVIFRARLRDIRRRRVVGDTIFDCSCVYFPGLAHLIGSY